MHKGRTTHIWNIEIRNEQDKLVSLCRLTVMILKRPSVMIHLNDKKEFVIFQKPHSNISYIGIGEWKRGNTINAISNAFVLSTFEGEIFHLITTFNPLNENVHIETSHNNTEISDNKSTYLQNASDIIKNVRMDILKMHFKQN